MSELNQEYENKTLPKEIWNKVLDNHNLPTTNKKEPIIEHKNNFEKINKQNVYIIQLEKADDEQNEKEKPDNYFSDKRENRLESIKSEVLEIPYIENDMNKDNQNKNLQNLENVNQEPKPKIVRQSHIEDFFSKLNEQHQNESKDNNINLNESYEKMNLKISSFEKISEQHYKPKLENFSNIPHLPSPGVGGVKMNDFDDSQIQEFNHIGVIQLNAQSEVNNNFCLVNISTNFYTNINPMLIFPGDTHSFEHHSDAPST